MGAGTLFILFKEEVGRKKEGRKKNTIQQFTLFGERDGTLHIRDDVARHILHSAIHFQIAA